MMLRFLLVSCAVVCVQSMPVDDFAEFDDSQIVQSLIREVRAAPENVGELIRPGTQHAFLHKYSDNDNDDNDQGYHKRVQDDDGRGYKHFDSYHKKDGNKHGFEHHTAYGQDGVDKGGYAAKNGEVESDATEEGEEAKKSYSVIEHVNEDYDDGAGSFGSYKEESDGEESDGDVGYYSEGSDDNSDGGHYTEEAESEDDGEGYGESEHYTANDEVDYD